MPLVGRPRARSLSTAHEAPAPALAAAAAAAPPPPRRRRTRCPTRSSARRGVAHRARPARRRRARVRALAARARGRRACVAAAVRAAARTGALPLAAPATPARRTGGPSPLGPVVLARRAARVHGARRRWRHASSRRLFRCGSRRPASMMSDSARPARALPLGGRRARRRGVRIAWADPQLYTRRGPRRRSGMKAEALRLSLRYAPRTTPTSSTRPSRSSSCASRARDRATRPSDRAAAATDREPLTCRCRTRSRSWLGARHAE